MDIFNSIKINRLCPVVAILDLLSRLLWTLSLMSRLHSRRASTRTTEPKIFLHLSFFGAKQFQFLGAEQTQKLWRRRCHKRFSIIKIGRRLFTPPILSISRAHWREKVKCSRRAFFLNWRAFSLATVAFLRPRFLHVYNYHFSSYPSSYRFGPFKHVEATFRRALLHVQRTTGLGCLTMISSRHIINLRSEFWSRLD